MTPITSADLYHLKPDREYHFRVTARNKYGWGESVVTSSPILTSSKTGLPQFHRQLHPQIKVLAGTDVLLSCEVTGEPHPEVEWFREGTKITDHRYELRSLWSSGSFKLHSMTIRNVRMETDDEAKISCEAFNPAGRVSTFTRISVRL